MTDAASPESIASPAIPEAPFAPGQEITPGLPVEAIEELGEEAAPLVLSAFRTPPGGKPGYKTTEFWLVLVVIALHAWAAFHHFLTPTAASVVIGILTAVYSILRAAVKTAASQLPASVPAKAVAPAVPASTDNAGGGSALLPPKTTEVAPQ